MSTKWVKRDPITNDVVGVFATNNVQRTRIELPENHSDILEYLARLEARLTIDEVIDRLAISDHPRDSVWLTALFKLENRIRKLENKPEVSTKEEALRSIMS